MTPFLFGVVTFYKVFLLKCLLCCWLYVYMPSCIVRIYFISFSNNLSTLLSLKSTLQVDFSYIWCELVGDVGKRKVTAFLWPLRGADTGGSFHKYFAIATTTHRRMSIICYTRSRDYRNDDTLLGQVHSNKHVDLHKLVHAAVIEKFTFRPIRFKNSRALWQTVSVV